MTLSTAANQKLASVTSRASKAASRRGFTLLEMMLVVMIIGILATVVVVSFGGKADTVKRTNTVSRLGQIKGELVQYYMQFGSYPASIDVLMTLRPPALEKLPKDGWDRLFNYAYPGSSNDANHPYDLYSNGKDNQPGTEDDIDVWNLDGTTPTNR